MSDSSGQVQSVLVGVLLMTPEQRRDPGEAAQRFTALVELNVMFPGGLAAARKAFEDLWTTSGLAGHSHVVAPPSPDDEQAPADPPVPPGTRFVTPRLYQVKLTRPELEALVTLDFQQAQARRRDRQPPSVRTVTDRRAEPRTIHKVWQDYALEPQIDRSAPTVKVDAAWRAYSARGHGIVWAVMDTGIDARHGHFADLEIGTLGGQGPQDPNGRTTGLHRDFRSLVDLDDEPLVGNALTDESGHGTHVAGIIAGHGPDPAKLDVIDAEDDDGGEPVTLQAAPTGDGAPPRRLLVAASKEVPPERAYVLRAPSHALSGMAPECELVSLKVLRRTRQGKDVTSASALIRALEYVRTEANAGGDLLRVHGVNMSLGCEWKAKDYAAGQSPLCQAINQLCDSGVLVVVSAGNAGATAGDVPKAVLGSILEPAHAEGCIAVGSTHREAPHAFGVTWTSSKGPTMDGRLKPDVVAPGEYITSAAAGHMRTRAGLPPADPAEVGAWTYCEDSGTSMAAPHVSGILAAFLSARPEFIGRPRQVKELLMRSATDLGRERYAQGAGLVDLMRMLSNV